MNRALSAVVVGAGLLLVACGAKSENRAADTSTTIAIPIPPPIHNDATPFPPPCARMCGIAMRESRNACVTLKRKAPSRNFSLVRCQPFGGGRGAGCRDRGAFFDR